MGKKSMLPGWGVVLVAAILGAFSIWCVKLLVEVSHLRDDVEQRVGWLSEVGNPDALPPPSSLSAMEQDAGLHPHVASLRIATEPGGAEVDAARRSLQLAIRAQTRDLSIRLGDRWNAMYSVAFTALILAALLLGLLIYLTRVLADRAHAREALLVERLAEADRLAVVGTLSAGIAHEISNPLARTHALLEEAVGTPNPDPALIAGALESARRTVEVLRDLRGLARSGAADPALPVDLREVLTSAADLGSAALRHVDLDFEMDPDLPLVQGRQARLRQLFLNLYTNAAQAIGQRERGRIVVRAWAAECEVHIEVEDNGPGIPEHMRQRAFEPFLTTKGTSGTGLGLFMCRRICESMGGRISMFEAKLGPGTIVEVVLRASAPASDSSRLSEPSRDRLRILIVDDEPGLADAIGLLLKDCAVKTATSGRDALQIIERGPEFDACLCDLDLPDIRGDELLRRLEARDRPLARRFILMSGHERGLDSASPHLQKPFTRAELRSTVRAMTDRRAEVSETLRALSATASHDPFQKARNV